MRNLIRVGVLLITAIAIALPLNQVQAAFPYKFTISGPGLNRQNIEVWMASNQNLLRVTQLGLLSKTLGTPPNDGQVIYEVNWWWGSCWLNTTCTTDPINTTETHTLYYFDSLRNQGYLYYLDEVGYRSITLRGKWTQVPMEFNQVFQQVIEANLLVF